MIVLTTTNEKKIALRPYDIVAVEEHPENSAHSVISYRLGERESKPYLVGVKHSVLEVVEAINKMSSVFG